MIEYFKDNLFMCVFKQYWFGLVIIEEYLIENGISKVVEALMTHLHAHVTNLPFI